VPRRLRDELAALKARAKPHSYERVFATQAGGALNQINVRNRTLALAGKRANERLEAAGSVPLPDGLSPHKLRHTFASLLVALGTDPAPSWTSSAMMTPRSRCASIATGCAAMRSQSKRSRSSWALKGQRKGSRGKSRG
jgi:integrase